MTSASASPSTAARSTCEDAAAVPASLRRYGKAIDKANCHPVVSNVAAPFRLCRVADG
ncbi:MAG: hypothetical protein O3A88_04595 [Proteobacteria bacterium]|nr:hypothetical protein [Pseudomonadota bacterium]